MATDSNGNNIVLPDGFDPDTADWTQGGYGEDLADIAATYGWTDWYPVLTGEGSYDAADVRPGAYLTPEEAIARLHAQGILAFSQLVYFPEDETWHVVVGDS